MPWNIVAIAISLATCAIVLSLLLRQTSRLPIDHPNDRSLHGAPTPRIGGLGILAGIGASFLLFRPDGILTILPLVFGLAIVSLIDDYFSLSARVRLLAHGGAALFFLLMTSTSGWMSTLAIFLCLVWMTNLYNFMDGADGLAGGMTFFGFGAYGIAAWYGESREMAFICWTISAAALGFLRFNFPPARIFMGDVGSIPLGFLAGTLGFLGWQQQLWPSWFPVLVFSPFIFDATATLIRRGLRSEEIWQAHKSHYYQRLVRLGLTHRQLALVEYGLMVAVAASALWVLHNQPEVWIELTVVWAIVYILLGVTLDALWRRKHGHGL